MAYAESGTGRETLVVVPGLVTHVTYDWQVPEIRAFYERLAEGRRLLRYDRIGGGLSDRADREYGPEDEAEDLWDLVRSRGSGPVTVFGWSQGCLAAVVLAASHPDAVSRLALCMGNPVGPAAQDPQDAPALSRSRALRELIAADFELACRTVIDAVLPHIDDGWARWAAAYMRMTLAPESLILRRLTADRADVRSYLPSISAPTVVLRRCDEAPLPRHHDPLGQGAWITLTPGQYMARHIPGSRLVDLPVGWHLPFLGDTQPMHAVLAAFFSTAAPPNLPVALTRREREVLRLIARGMSNREIASDIGCSPSTVKRHAENIYSKLGVSSRTAATALAVRDTLG